MSNKIKDNLDVILDVEIKKLTFEEMENLFEKEGFIEGRGTTQRVYIDIYNETSENFMLASRGEPLQGKWERSPPIKLFANSDIRAINIGSAFAGPKGFLRYETFDDKFCNVNWHWSHNSKFSYSVNSGPAPIYSEDKSKLHAQNYILITVHIRNKK
ncbi:hypothetical protein I5E97_02890 [Proteus hauseri]|uniref:hypothetical protein n=1 Tax=Proteus cibi TaxID=2050966 RepID=UPI0003C5EEC0|nr:MULTISPECIES: hypothetical protein [Proteus]EST58868.1 hypothetical protein K151_1665 [Proteus hauseri ZMd44]MBG6029994.1 hypothetical protein [Proteus hauseri]MBS6211411.1 hypothetical protein [Proteus hauseri]